VIHGRTNVAVVVLTFRPRPGALAACIDSVLRSADADAVVVVDNGGAIDDVPGVELRSAPVTIVRPTVNRGYAGGMNAGVQHAKALGAAAVALLNDDTTVEPGWLGPLREELDAGSRDRVGAVQPKLLLAGRTPAVLNSAGVRWRGDGAGIDIGYGETDVGQYDRPRPIELFTGGAVLLSMAFLDDTRGFDERYFMYYEDIDLGLRGRERGWTYRFAPASVVHHVVGATAKAMPDERRFWQERNRLWCLFRHGRPTAIGRGLLLSALRLAKHPTRPQAAAIGRGLQGAPSMLWERRAARR
jgi:N-acetylglucosaminyl-diphospho-decaprenol L-rhamnosyltransferase